MDRDIPNRGRIRYDQNSIQRSQVAQQKQKNFTPSLELDKNTPYMRAHYRNRCFRKRESLFFGKAIEKKYKLSRTLVRILDH